MSKTLDRAFSRIEVELDSLLDDITPEDGSPAYWSSKTPDQWNAIYRDIHRAARTLAMLRQAKAAELVLEVMRDLASKIGLEVPWITLSAELADAP